MPKTKVEKVYCWTGNHEIDPAQWMSQAGMCQVCYASIESDVLTAHAEPVTDPHLPAVSGGKPCGVKDCPNTASPWICCASCGIALCANCATTKYSEEDHENKAYCPTHKKGGK